MNNPHPDAKIKDLGTVMGESFCSDNQKMKEIGGRHKDKYPQKNTTEQVRLQICEHLSVFRPMS